MANTRQSAKRARQTVKRQSLNQNVRNTTRTALSKALEAVRNKDGEKAKEAYQMAVKALSKAASKGALPQGRAARKISRLTRFAQKALPQLFAAGAKKAPASKSASK